MADTPKETLRELTPLQDLLLRVIKIGEKDFGIKRGLTQEQIFAAVDTLKPALIAESDRRLTEISPEDVDLLLQRYIGGEK